MPANARKDIVREGEIGIYHCWSRCVQRAFLCGFDAVTQRDFDYRRGWIESLLAYLAGVFAIDVGNYSVLSNHFHALLRTRPDLAAMWSAEEVALRWKLAWPEFRDKQWVREPTDAEIETLLAQPALIERLRGRLCSLSWYMGRLKEPIARQCNAEMDTSGHFWDARFRSRELLDDEATLTCSLYIDLNQVKAGMADALEDCRHSAVRQRILAAKVREARASYDDVLVREPDLSGGFSLEQAQLLFADCHLAPIAAEGPLLTTDASQQAQQHSGLTRDQTPTVAARLILPASCDACPEPAESHEQPEAATEATSADDRQETPAATADTATMADTPQPSEAQPGEAQPQPPPVRRRASDVPFLGMAWTEYLRIARTLASRIVRERSRPGAPRPTVPDQPDPQDLMDEPELHAALARWGFNPAVWLAQFERLDRQCTRALGRAERVLRRAQEVAQQRFHGIAFCRAVFAEASSEGFT